MADSIYISYDNKIFRLRKCNPSTEELLSVNCGSTAKCNVCNYKPIQLIDIGGIPQCFGCCVDSEFISNFIDEMDIYQVYYCARFIDEIIIVDSSLKKIRNLWNR